MSAILQLNELTAIFNNQINKLPNDVGLCLSGGIDSVALLSLLLKSDKNITIYSFTLQNYISEDFKRAKELANRFNCKFIPIYLPISIDVLKRDIIKLHQQYACIKKTEYECVWPFLYVYPKITESVIVAGLGAEGHFGSTKRGSIHFKNDLDSFRKQFFNNGANPGQIQQHVKLCKEYSLNLWFPFLSNDIITFFMGKTWNDINKPKIKQPILDLIDFDFSPKSSNLQIGSNIRNHFDLLLETDWNTANYRSIVGILNSINRKYEINGKRKLI